jgi:hypothetical protein
LKKVHSPQVEFVSIAPKLIMAVTLLRTLLLHIVPVLFQLMCRIPPIDRYGLAHFSYWLLVIGCWLLVIGYWLLVIGC